MGTVNYGRSDYITLGVKPFDAWDIEKDADLMLELQENVTQYGGTIESEISEYLQECYTCNYDNIAAILDKYRFYYFHVAIKSGYYEGFYLDIEFNFPCAFDNWEEKREAQKEVTLIKQCLLECAGYGLVECSPGWVTSYSNYKTTVKAIRAAVKQMRNDIAITPTWAVYNRAEGVTA